MKITATGFLVRGEAVGERICGREESRCTRGRQAGDDAQSHCWPRCPSDEADAQGSRFIQSAPRCRASPAVASRVARDLVARQTAARWLNPRRRTLASPATNPHGSQSTSSAGHQIRRKAFPRPAAFQNEPRSAVVTALPRACLSHG